MSPGMAGISATMAPGRAGINVPVALGRAEISVPMAPGRTGISVPMASRQGRDPYCHILGQGRNQCPPCPQEREGSASSGTPRACRDLWQGRQETGLSIPSGTPPCSIPTAPHIPHLTLHVPHPCGVAPLRDTRSGCRSPRQNAQVWLPT